MRILLVPPSDYLGHPNPCRLHHIFERFHLYHDEVYAIRFSLHDRILRKSTAKVFSINDVKFGSLALYYLMNSGIFVESINSVVKNFDIDVVLFANLYPPYIASRTIPNRVLSVLDLVDHYPSVAARNSPEVVPKKLVEHLFEHMMKSVIRRCDSTVACSYGLATYAKRKGDKDVYRIPNGVEEYFFSDYNKEALALRNKFGIGDSDILICFVGNIEYWLSYSYLQLAREYAQRALEHPTSSENARREVKKIIDLLEQVLD